MAQEPQAAANAAACLEGVKVYTRVARLKFDSGEEIDKVKGESGNNCCFFFDRNHTPARTTLDSWATFVAEYWPAH